MNWKDIPKEWKEEIKWRSWLSFKLGMLTGGLLALLVVLAQGCRREPTAEKHVISMDLKTDPVVRGRV